MRGSSLEAWHGIIVPYVFSKQQKAIFAAMSPNMDYSLQELARLTRINLRSVSARVSDMVAINMLERDWNTNGWPCKRSCSVTGNSCDPVRVVANRDGRGLAVNITDRTVPLVKHLYEKIEWHPNTIKSKLFVRKDEHCLVADSKGRIGMARHEGGYPAINWYGAITGRQLLDITHFANMPRGPKRK